MKPANPTQKVPDNGGEIGISGPRSVTTIPVPRGEIFDFESGNAPLDTSGKEVARFEKKQIGVLLVVLAFLFCFYNFAAYVGSKSKRPAPLGPFANPTLASPSLRVEVAGAVQRPGLYTLPGDARVQDALQSAGGPTPDADLSALNQAAIVADGAKIVVPTKTMALPAPLLPSPRPVNATPIPPTNITNTPNTASPPAIQPTNGTISPPPAQNNQGASQSSVEKTPNPDSKTSPDALDQLRRNPVDLNRAGVPELSVLPGVGEKLAQRIVAYRTQNGAFRSVDELDNVPGFGTKRLDALQGLVTVQ